MDKEESTPRQRVHSVQSVEALSGNHGQSAPGGSKLAMQAVLAQALAAFLRGPLILGSTE